MDTVSHLAPPSVTISPPRPATILDYLGGPLTPSCPKCGNLVVIRWIPNGDEFAARADAQDALRNDCHRCVLAAAPEMYRATLEDRFKHMLTVRRTLHALQTLGSWQPDPDGIYRTVPATLTYMTWQPPNQSGARAPYLEEFSVIGCLPEGFDEDAVRQTLAPSPAFRTKPMSEPVAGVASWAIVQMAIHARHPAVPATYLEWRWDPNVPELSWEPMIRGFARDTPKNIALLLSKGRQLFAIHRTNSGRPPGSGGYLQTAEDVEAAVFAVVRALLHKNKKPGYRPLYKEIAKRLDEQYRRHKPNWEDPERSFTLLCAARGLSPRDLVDRAIAACATGE